MKIFPRAEDGSTLVEGLIVFPIILLTFATFIEFGVAMVQWNQTVKAMQFGARVLAVSDPIVDMAPFTADYPTTEGGPVPTTAVTVECGASRPDEPELPPCFETGLNRLVFGSDGVCGPVADTRLGMCDLNGLIAPENIRVSYYRSGLGYVGRPGGPVVSITVATRNLNFRFFFLGALFRYFLDDVTDFVEIEIPAHPVTITSEDLSNTI